MSDFPGYRGSALKAIEKAGVRIEDEVTVISRGIRYDGVLIPRSEYSDDRHIVVKLKSGYNIGIEITSETRIVKKGSRSRLMFTPPARPKSRADLPKVSILSTGGTIASRVDYRTGAVRPAISADDLYSIIPELSDIADIRAEIVCNLFSEDLTSSHWTKIAESVAEHLRSGVDGIVITHGTDTMGYTAAALSFAIQDLPVPLVLVGAQRSEDRPSSDAASNLIGAVQAAAKASFSEVTVAMHNSISDDSIVLHSGTKVRKCHTSRRDAFKSINDKPIAVIKDGNISLLTDHYRRRDSERSFVLKPSFEEKVALIKFYPGFNPHLIETYVDMGYRGIILEGTGLGHISQACIKSIKQALEREIIVAMTSQCIWGRVNMNVYTNGRDLLALGVLPLNDMLSETALAKLMWVLGQTNNVDQAKNLMLNNICYEMSGRTIYL